MNECNSLAFFGTGQSLTLSTFLGWQIFHQLTRCDPEKSHWPEKITSFGLIFKLNDLSWFNTNWIWSNIVLASGAKIQMLSRHSSKVTNSWSPRHCSIKLQKLDLVCDRPKGIQVNFYRPEEPALNVVFLMLSSAIANCKYPFTRSKEVKKLILCTAYASLMVMEFNFL